jgi:phospholipase/carboxylesterase
MSLDVISLPPQSGRSPQGTVVVLHGWGANYNDLLALAPYMSLPHCQFFFANAPFLHPLVPGGRMWYNIPIDYSFEFSSDQENFPARQPDIQAELQTSRQQLLDYLESLEVSTGVPLARTILAGFSQGGAMTLDVGVRLPLAAMVVMSGYLHAPLERQGDSPAPVWMVHGQLDPVVPLEAARQARDRLQSQDIPVNYREIPDMGHEISVNALSEMQSFLREITANWSDIPESP